MSLPLIQKKLHTGENYIVSNSNYYKIRNPTQLPHIGNVFFFFLFFILGWKRPGATWATEGSVPMAAGWKWTLLKAPPSPTLCTIVRPASLQDAHTGHSSAQRHPLGTTAAVRSASALEPQV